MTTTSQQFFAGAIALTVMAASCGDPPRQRRVTPGGSQSNDSGMTADMWMTTDMSVRADMPSISDMGTTDTGNQGLDAGHDMTSSADLGMDMPSTFDMGVATDMSMAEDMPPTVDMAPDMPPTVDMAPDMPPTVDMEPDMPPTIDMAPDMPPTVDMAPDMPPTVDMAPDMPPTVDMAPDMPPTVDMAPDMPPTVDMAPDMPPVIDMAPDMVDMNDGTGLTCPYTDLTPFNGPCNPVDNTGCGVGMACVVVAQIIGPNVVLSSGCRSEADRTLMEGDACGNGNPQSCAPTLRCITFYDTCHKLCFNDDAYGCAPDEYCRRPSPSWGGLGFCDSTCNL